MDVSNEALELAGGLVIRRARLHLTVAQILNLKAAPVEIVPDPGAGLAIFPIATWLQYNFVTTPYDVTGTAGQVGTAAQIAASTGYMSFGGSGLLDLGASEVFCAPSALIINPLANLDGAIFVGQGGASDFAAGDGTLDVEVLYAVIPTA